MQVRFKQCLIVDRHNYVTGDVATLDDEKAKRLIHAGAVEPYAPAAKREAVANPPKTRKAALDA